MKKNLFFVFLLLGIFTACNNTASNQDEANEDATSTEEPALQTFGEKITPDGAIAYNDFLQKFAGKDSLAMKVSGKVSDVCQKKGCWMNIVSDEEGAPDMFVKFKDYGFFMPLDIAGRTVVMDGYAFKEVTSVDELRHYAEDEGKSKEEIEAITEPEERLNFLASGVVLLNE